MAEIVCVVPRIPARDVQAAVDWYVEKLGFERRFVYPDDNPQYAGIARNGAEIHLFKMDIDPAKSDFMIYLRVQGIKELYEEIAPRGVIHPNGPIQLRPWGQIEFAVIDLDGTCLTFGEPV